MLADGIANYVICSLVIKLLYCDCVVVTKPDVVRLIFIYMFEIVVHDVTEPKVGSRR